jgi:acetyl esterase/lipase
VSLLGSDEVRAAGNDLRLNPGNATEKEVTKLPPTTFGIAGYDPLRDEGLFYAKLLSDNG